MENLYKNLQKIKITKEEFNKLPQTSGIYIFWKNNTPIYIGKSVNLQQRLKSYLLINLGPKTNQMVKNASCISFIKVSSELEALLLESYLIHKFKPKYNIILKDDKNPLYIIITKDRFPLVISSRKPVNSSYKDIFGPFPNSTNVKTILRLIRKIVPYADHKINKKPCLYSHINLCNPCPNFIFYCKDPKERDYLTKKYLKNIKLIKGILSRKFNLVRKLLDKKMKINSKLKNYEEAALVRDQIKALDYITQPRLSSTWYIKNPNLIEDISLNEINNLKKILKINKLKRIECYDISHTGGTNVTASMVTFINGEPDKNLYRRFMVKQKKGFSDFDSMKEISKRRSNHFIDWGKPDLIIVDGGLSQIKAFNVDVLVVGISKNPDRLILSNGKKIIIENNNITLVQKMRDEAHRFARKYHHLLIKKNLLN